MVSNSRTRSPGHERAKKRSRNQSTSQKIDTNKLRKKVFSLTPTQLREYYLVLDDLADNLELLEATDEDISDEGPDAEIDTADPDDPETVDDRASSPEASTAFGENGRDGEQAVLDLEDCYRLCVIPGDADWQCRFAPPAWMLSRRKGDPLPALLNGLQALARWLEHDKQAFLREPSPERYAQRPCGTHETPAVTQKGLLSTIDANPGRTQWSFPNEQDLSDLKDKVWICWPHLCMPIETLFSREFCFSWAVARCEEHAPVSEWVEVSVYPLSVEEFKDARRLSPQDRDLSQTLAVFCKAFSPATNPNPDEVHDYLIAKGRRDHHG